MNTQTTPADLESRPLYETVYEALKGKIADGSLRAGETLSEVQLAEDLAVSRTPVREAVRRLVAEKLLFMPAKGAVRVYSPTAVDLADVYCTRAALEGMAARLAGMRSDASFIRRLMEICDRCDALPNADDVHEATRLNGEFHRAILEQADNRRISDLLENLNPVIVRYRHVSLSYKDHLAQSWNEHRTIAKLFEKNSPDEIEAHVRNHIIAAGGRIVAAMRAMEPPGGTTPSMDLALDSARTGH